MLDFASRKSLGIDPLLSRELLLLSAADYVGGYDPSAASSA